MKSKQDELNRHMDALRFHHPEVSEAVWKHVYCRMGWAWDDGRSEGINQLACNHLRARQAEREQVEQRYLDRAKVKA